MPEEAIYTTDFLASIHEWHLTDKGSIWIPDGDSKRAEEWTTFHFHPRQWLKDNVPTSKALAISLEVTASQIRLSLYYRCVIPSIGGSVYLKEWLSRWSAQFRLGFQHSEHTLPIHKSFAWKEHILLLEFKTSWSWSFYYLLQSSSERLQLQQRLVHVLVIRYGDELSVRGQLRGQRLLTLPLLALRAGPRQCGSPGGCTCILKLPERACPACSLSSSPPGWQLQRLWRHHGAVPLPQLFLPGVQAFGGRHVMHMWHTCSTL